MNRICIYLLLWFSSFLPCLEAGSITPRHWAYDLPKAANLPAVRDSNWPRTPIDVFILAHLERLGRHPANDASPDVVARRLYFDLIGLPPTPEEVDAFVTASAVNATTAREKLVDRLLSSPRFGERWGRHWLDIARFAESITLRGLIFPEAWRYRNYVIESFNYDVPFDIFLKEQIAGDLLSYGSAAGTNRGRIATTYLVLGNFNYEAQDKDQLRMDIVDEQLDTIGKGLLGETIGCARCHDHKTDPISTREYYSLAAIFRNTRSADLAPLSKWLEVPLTVSPADEERLEAQAKDVGELNRLIRKKVDALAMLLASTNNTPEAGLALKDELKTLREKVEHLKASGPRQPAAMSVMEGEVTASGPFCLRGDVHTIADTVPRGFLNVASHGPVPEFPTNESGRRELANWIASTNNPLTARVYVNRVWQWLIGRGLVRTPDNFGPSGEAPTHPELLDYLALRFTAEGWSTKQLVREIVLSRVYQLSSHVKNNGSRDPENRLLDRAFRRRLDAESLRDAMLLASGSLCLQQPGSTIRPGTTSDYEYTDQNRYRSVYVPVLRNSLPQLFEAFDFADTSNVTGERSRSITSGQALFFLNDPFVVEQARLTAQRLLREEPNRDGARVEKAYRLIVGRRPSGEELRTAAEQLAGSTRTGASQTEAWTELCQALFASFEFRTLD